jgi:mandelate racemase
VPGWWYGTWRYGRWWCRCVYPEVSGHLLRITPTGQWLEWQDWAHPVLARPFKVSSGRLHLPDVPGNGLDWDEGAVTRYQAVP